MKFSLINRMHFYADGNDRLVMQSTIIYVKSLRNQGTGIQSTNEGGGL